MTYGPISTSASRLSKDVQKRNRLAAKIRRQTKLTAAAERRKDTRRKILVGAILITAAETDPALQQTIQHLLETKLTRPDDRALFDLSALSQDSYVENATLPPHTLSNGGEGPQPSPLADAYRQASQSPRSSIGRRPRSSRTTKV